MERIFHFSSRWIRFAIRNLMRGQRIKSSCSAVRRTPHANELKCAVLRSTEDLWLTRRWFSLPSPSRMKGSALFFTLAKGLLCPLRVVDVEINPDPIQCRVPSLARRGSARVRNQRYSPAPFRTRKGISPGPGGVNQRRNGIDHLAKSPAGPQDVRQHDPRFSSRLLDNLEEE
jgi:hypothetical protein